MAVSTNKRSIMTLYSGNNDPYSHRVRMVLAEKGVTYDIVDATTSTKVMEELAQYNPYGTVPTLVDRDLVLYRSDIIMEYLDERFPHPPLLPIYPVAKGRSRLMTYRVNHDWYKPMDKILNPSLEEEIKASARKELKESLMTVIPVFAELPFFLSEELTLVDCCIAPLLWRLPKLKVELPVQAKPILDYAERLFKLESFQESLTEVERSSRTTAMA